MAYLYPKMPPSKIFDGGSTPETRVIMKLIQQQTITREEETILDQCKVFYWVLYNFFRTIDLSKLTDEQAEKLIVYTSNNVQMVVNSTNVIYFTDLFRDSKVKPEFLENEKVYWICQLHF